MYLSKNDDSTRVVEQLRSNFRSLSAKIGKLPLREAVSVLTTGTDYKVQVPRTLKEAILLACISWYLPDLLRPLVQVELETRYGRNLEFAKVNYCLTSEPEMILYILESDALGRTSQEVFGNIRGTRLEFKILKVYARKPKRTVRHRGYRDKGSLGKNTQIRQEELKDWTLRVKQLEREVELDRFINSITWTIGFIQ